MSRSIVAALAGAVLAAGVVVGAVALGGSAPGVQGALAADRAYSEAQSRVPVRVQAARAQRTAVIAMRRATAATKANRTLRQRLGRAEARIAALEAAGGIPSPGAPAPTPPPPPGPGPTTDDLPTPGGSTPGTWLNYEIVFKTADLAPPGVIRTDWVECPDGYRAMGGGIWTGTLHLQNVLTNNIQQVAGWPVIVGNTGRWYVRVINPAAGARGYRVYAACAQIGPPGP